MSRRYSPDHKALVIRILHAYRGDIRATARFTGIPERTLRDWRLQVEAQLRRQQARPGPPKPG